MSDGPGDRAGIPLEAEPVEWLDPALVGTVTPGAVQPVQQVLALEEEPALWLRLPAGRPPLPPPEQVADPARPATPVTSAPVLPATGTAGASVGAFAVVLGWALRRRFRTRPDR